MAQVFWLGVEQRYYVYMVTARTSSLVLGYDSTSEVDAEEDDDGEALAKSPLERGQHVAAGQKAAESKESEGHASSSSDADEPLTSAATAFAHMREDDLVHLKH